MLRDGLAREFPGLFPFIERVRPRVPAASPLWAALAALGAYYLVDAVARPVLAQIVRVATRDYREPFIVPPFELAAVAAASAAAAIALRSGGVRALVVLLAALLLPGVLGDVLRSAERDAFCDRGGGRPAMLCGPSVADLVLVRWPVAVGTAAGPILARWLVRGPGGVMPALEAAGALAVAARVLTLGTSAWVVVPDGTYDFLAVPLALQLTAAIAAGMLIASRSRTPLRSASIVAATITAAWVVFIVAMPDQLFAPLPPQPIVYAAQVLPLLTASVLLVVTWIATTLRRRTAAPL